VQLVDAVHALLPASALTRSPSEPCEWGEVMWSLAAPGDDLLRRRDVDAERDREALRGPHRLSAARASVAGRGRRLLGEHEPVADVKLVDQMVGGLAIERDDPQEPPERAMRGDAQVLGALIEGHDHVALDIAERALPLAIGIPREGAGPLAAPPGETREGPNRRVGIDGSDEGADPLVADVVQRRARQQPDAAARRSGDQQASYRLARLALIGVCPAESGHRFVS
jgi:hypothetical protein